MILVDANVLMYAAGAAHPHKAASVHLLRRVASGDLEAALDAEVLQEVLHRYRALGRWAEGRRVFDQARVIFPVVFPITVTELDRARALLDRYAAVMARDALHAAVVMEQGLEAICSFDRDFDQLAGITRREP
ncbi:MAG: type II toxin-antitoxin system VapC family toxin [Gemmatimonadales bacterium]